MTKFVRELKMTLNVLYISVVETDFYLEILFQRQQQIDWILLKLIIFED